MVTKTTVSTQEAKNLILSMTFLLYLALVVSRNYAWEREYLEFPGPG